MITAVRFGFGPGSLVVLLALVGGVSPQSAGADSWKPVGKISQGRVRPSLTLLADGTVLVAGGDVAVNGQLVGTASAERFDPKTNQFLPQGPMRSAHGGIHAAVRLHDGRVLVMGAEDETNTVVASADLFDPGTSSFTRTGPMTVPRSNMTGTLLPDGRVLVVGGYRYDPATVTVYASAELFDPATETFSPAGSVGSPRVDHAAVALPDGRVVILGGSSDAGSEGGKLLRPVEIYDPAPGTFTVHGELAIPRVGMTASLLPDGKILVAGGATVGQNGLVLQNDVEIYDPTTGQSKVVSNLPTPHWDYAATALPGGQILLIGGWKNTSVTAVSNRVDLFDPVSGQVSSIASMLTGRSQEEAIGLSDGRVLVLGGSPGPLRTAEVYVP
jgi:hypothetical protein